MSAGKAILMLADGTAFEGKPFGKVGRALGDVVFYTGVVGYQELLTNPSYYGELAVLTYPIIGSYGVNADDNESPGVHPAGVVIREYSAIYSNWRATGALEPLLIQHGVVGIREVDTRAVAVHLREHGEMRGVIASGKFDAEKLAAALAKPATGNGVLQAVSWEGRREPSGKPRQTVALVNLGVKESLLRQLVDLGCIVEVLGCAATADDVLATKAKRVIFSGGPGDPRQADGPIETAEALLGKIPLLGIGLGHQVLAQALGGQVSRLKVGHRGVNYPVKDLAGGAAAITVQHHSFVVDAESLPDSVEVTHTNLNDGTVEGIRSAKLRACGVQFHPSRDDTQRPSPVLAAFCAGT